MSEVPSRLIQVSSSRSEAMPAAAVLGDPDEPEERHGRRGQAEEFVELVPRPDGRLRCPARPRSRASPARRRPAGRGRGGCPPGRRRRRPPRAGPPSGATGRARATCRSFHVIGSSPTGGRPKTRGSRPTRPADSDGDSAPADRPDRRRLPQPPDGQGHEDEPEPAWSPAIQASSGEARPSGGEVGELERVEPARVGRSGDPAGDAMGRRRAEHRPTTGSARRARGLRGGRQ